MNSFIEKFIIRNLQKVPYFFNQKPKFSFEQNNYALIGKLSASLLHDILTPLTSLSLSADIGEKSNIQTLKPLIQNSTGQIVEYVKIMKDFLIEDSGKSVIHINNEISKCITLLRHKAISHGVQIQYLEFDQIHSNIHPLHIYQIIINLLSNAIEASEMTQTKKIILIIKKEKSMCHIECKDFGTGMSVETISKIGTCNFSTKSIHRGFGLYSVRHILTDILRGELRIQSEPDNGSLFSCILPIKT